ncbi:MAG TPA: branched-chain amino acid ABC transporter permease [Casimicrobiaceae bacterium]|nr:branched-chain amino acid ABC transporter permease [Casimicrobiaceae bacterium]
MGALPQLLVSGIAAGSIYALAALGFTLLWQASGTINFAQGEFVMIPAFVVLFFVNAGAPLWLSFLFTCIVAMLLLGAGFKRAIVDPLIRHGVIPLVIASLGLSIGLKQLMKSGYSAQAFPFPSLFPAGQFSIAGTALSYADVGTLAIAATIVLALQAFLDRTVTGRSMQAVAQNREAARVLGIDVSRMVLYTFLINALLAVVAALLVTPAYLAKFDMGDSLGQKAFFAAIIGGFNETRGALLGGVLIGVLENVVGFYVSPAYKEGVALVLFLVVILVRPEGLLGKPQERKV